MTLQITRSQEVMHGSLADLMSDAPPSSLEAMTNAFMGKFEGKPKYQFDTARGPVFAYRGGQFDPGAISFGNTELLVRFMRAPRAAKNDFFDAVYKLAGQEGKRVNLQLEVPWTATKSRILKIFCYWEMDIDLL